MDREIIELLQRLDWPRELIQHILDQLHAEGEVHLKLKRLSLSQHDILSQDGQTLSIVIKRKSIPPS